MRIACHYLEGKDIHPVTPGEVSAGAAPLDASASDASSTTGEDSEEVRTVGSDQVGMPATCSCMLWYPHLEKNCCQFNLLLRFLEAVPTGHSGPQL